jgi:hypothetical protein
MENATYLTSAIGLGSGSNREASKSTKFCFPQAVLFSQESANYFRKRFTMLLIPQKILLLGGKTSFETFLKCF